LPEAAPERNENSEPEKKGGYAPAADFRWNATECNGVSAGRA